MIESEFVKTVPRLMIPFLVSLYSVLIPAFDYLISGRALLC